MTQFICRAVIFDLDGVLVDSRACIEYHWRIWAAKHQLDLATILRVDSGRRPIETIGIVAPGLDAAQEAAQFEADEAFDIRGVIKIAGAARLLNSLPPRQWGIATSATKDTALTRINHTGLPIPDVLVTADDVTQGKPHPEAYLLAANRLGIAPQDCLVVEDAPAGIKAALEAGMQVLAIASTHSASELTAASLVVESIAKIQLSSSHQSADLVLVCH